MKSITIYTTNVCPYCIQAKRLMSQLGLQYKEVNLEDNHDLRQRLSDENNGYRTVPMIFIGDQFIGGYDELRTLVDQKKLDAKLK